MYCKSYFCVCAGQQEEMYLKHLAQLLKKPEERVVTFNTTVGSAELLEKTILSMIKRSCLIMTSMRLSSSGI
jgi:hypothetical protein